jgi:hypothetical protein
MRIHYFLIAYKSLFFTWSLWTHRTHGLSIVTVAGAPIHATRIEAQAVRADRGARVERTRPVVAVATRVVETFIIEVACSGEEDRLVL